MFKRLNEVISKNFNKTQKNYLGHINKRQTNENTRVKEISKQMKILKSCKSWYQLAEDESVI